MGVGMVFKTIQDGAQAVNRTGEHAKYAIKKAAASVPTPNGTIGSYGSVKLSSIGKEAMNADFNFNSAEFKDVNVLSMARKNNKTAPVIDKEMAIDSNLGVISGEGNDGVGLWNKVKEHPFIAAGIVAGGVYGANQIFGNDDDEY